MEYNLLASNFCHGLVFAIQDSYSCCEPASSIRESENFCRGSMLTTHDLLLMIARRIKVRNDESKDKRRDMEGRERWAEESLTG